MTIQADLIDYFYEENLFGFYRSIRFILKIKGFKEKKVVFIQMIRIERHSWLDQNRAT